MCVCHRVDVYKKKETFKPSDSMNTAVDFIPGLVAPRVDVFFTELG
jgi:hypothetical protein